MKVGFNLLLWTSHVTEQHYPLLPGLKKAGYDGIEIPILEGTPEYYRKVLPALRDSGLALQRGHQHAGRPSTTRSAPRRSSGPWRWTS